MAKEKEYKCPVCGNMNKQSIAIHHGSRRYCKSCFDEMMKKKELKKQTQSLKKQEQEQNAREYKELIAYVCELFDISQPTGMILSQIKNYRETYQYRYGGMTLTLKYHYEVLGNPLKAEGVGIIPYAYDKAKEFYTTQRNIAIDFENFKEPFITHRVVYLTKQKESPSRYHGRRRVTNMTELE